MMNFDFEKFNKYYNGIVENCHEDDEAFDMFQHLLNRAIEYSNIRAKWSLMSIEEKNEKDSYRTACHESFINSLKIYLRYLDKLGIKLLASELIEMDRKIIGDFANYIVFAEAVKNR